MLQPASKYPAGHGEGGSTGGEQSNVAPGSLEEFFRFLQCQLRMEARERLGKDLDLQDDGAHDVWPKYEAWVRPNLGRREKWMPFHTVLGAHELFIVEKIHHAELPGWDDRRKFLAVFIFRAHCNRKLFEAQLPHLMREDFWNDPATHFDDHGTLSKSMLEYRRRTREPLQTQAFRCIPARLCPDDDENLVRNIARRTRTLLEVAANIWPILHDTSKTAVAKFDSISSEVQRGKGIGETWAKMLMVSIDIAYPHLGLLAQKCDVGIGAVGGLKRLVPGFGEDGSNGPRSPQAALEAVTSATNKKCPSLPGARHFWALLPQVEAIARESYASLPLVMRQMDTPLHGLSAVTVQVQLCEWRQFHDYCLKTSSGPELPLSGSSTSMEHRTKEDAEAAVFASDEEDDLPLAALPQVVPAPAAAVSGAGGQAAAPEEEGGVLLAESVGGATSSGRKRLRSRRDLGAGTITAPVEGPEVPVLHQAYVSAVRALSEDVHDLVTDLGQRVQAADGRRRQLETERQAAADTLAAARCSYDEANRDLRQRERACTRIGKRLAEAEAEHERREVEAEELFAVSEQVSRGADEAASPLAAGLRLLAAAAFSERPAALERCIAALERAHGDMLRDARHRGPAEDCLRRGLHAQKQALSETFEAAIQTGDKSAVLCKSIEEEHEDMRRTCAAAVKEYTLRKEALEAATAAFQRAEEAHATASVEAERLAMRHRRADAEARGLEAMLKAASG